MLYAELSMYTYNHLFLSVFFGGGAGIHSFNHIFRRIFVPPQILIAIDLGLSQSGDLYLVVSIKINKIFRRKDFSFPSVLCSFIEALICAQSLCWIHGCSP